MFCGKMISFFQRKRVANRQKVEELIDPKDIYMTFCKCNDKYLKVSNPEIFAILSQLPNFDLVRNFLCACLKVTVCW